MARLNPRLIELARDSRGITQAELARLIKVTQGALSKIENGVVQPTEAVAEKLAAELKYPLAFFQVAAEIHGIGTEQFHQVYRRRAAMPAKTLKKIEAQVNLVRMHVARWLEAVEMKAPSTIPILDPEDFSGGVDEVARLVRAGWNMPAGRVENLVEKIETAGGIVIPFDFEGARVDATSFRYPGLPPLFFVNKNTPGDRQRFTLAHELGHMVMHATGPAAEMEEEADQFAAELLMPAKEIGPALTDMTLKRAAQLKPYWKVSMGALLRRARDLGKLAPRGYQQHWIRMSALGWRTREPQELDVPVETPKLHRSLIDMHLSGLGYTTEELAQALCVRVEDLMHLHGIPGPAERSGLRLVI